MLALGDFFHMLGHVRPALQQPRQRVRACDKRLAMRFEQIEEIFLPGHPARHRLCGREGQRSGEYDKAVNCYTFMTMLWRSFGQIARFVCGEGIWLGKVWGLDTHTVRPELIERAFSQRLRQKEGQPFDRPRVDGEMYSPNPSVLSLSKH